MKNYLHRTCKVLLTAGLLWSVFCSAAFASYRIERDVKGKAILRKALKSIDPSTLHFLSHGRSGALRIDGKWLNAQELVPVFKKVLQKEPLTIHINIYGCEFAEGQKGREAVAYLEQQLGVSIAASENKTGKNGDWNLEVGRSVSIAGLAHYPYTLQYGPDDDFDGDGIINSIDLDDDNDGVLDSEECSDLGYTNYFGYKDDLMTAFAHGVIARTATGYIAWGNVTKPNGASSTGVRILGTPEEITPANGYNYTGKILLATGGNHDQGTTNQTILLTTDGLFVFGTEGAVIHASLTSSSSVQSIALPSGLTVADIQKITATCHSFALLTKSGDAYVMGANYFSYGDGSSSTDANWHKVDVPKPLVNIKVGAIGNLAFAQASDGTLYTWGKETYLGDGSAAADRTTPAVMAPLVALPDEVLPAQIALGSAYTSGAYHVLGRDGKVYSIGHNGNGQMGNGTTTGPQLTWTIAQTSSGNDLTDIVFINANDNSSAPATNSSVSAINDQGQLYSWGYNGSYTIGFPAGADQKYAGIPTNTSGKAIRYVENGYHITPVIDSQGNICNVGHNAEGAFGDGTSGDRQGYQCNTLLGGPYVLSAALANVCDMDGDGIPNQFDLDSDGDGCPDSQEAGVVPSFPDVEFANIDVTNSGGTVYAEKSKLSAGTFVDTNSNGFDDRLETGSAGSYSGSYTYNFAVNANYRNCVPTTQATHDINQTPLNKTVTGNVLTNDVDPQGDPQTVTEVIGWDENGDPKVIPVTNTPTPVYDQTGVLAGTLAINSTGTYTFVPETGYTGSVAMTYTVSDSHGATAQADLRIKVLPEATATGNPPIAVNDENTVKAGGTVTTHVMANDSDIDGDVISVSAATGLDATGNPINLTSSFKAVYDENKVLAGTARLNANGTIEFKADENFTGKVPFNYTITDGAKTDSAVLTITVDPAAPSNVTYSNDDTQTGKKGVAQSGSVLTNDYDPEGDEQTITAGVDANGTSIVPGVAHTLPGGGSFTIHSNGSYTYTPTAGFVGTEVIVYTVCDDNNPKACSNATLYLTTLGISSELPVTLISFQVRSGKEGNQLTWTTAREFGFDRFVVEKSSYSGRDFVEIGEVKGGTDRYAFLDKSAAKGISYYRLKMLDNDGTYAYSRMVSAYQEYGVDEHIVFPNPSKNHSFYIHNYFSLESFKVYNVTGKEVRVKLDKEAGNYKFSLEAEAPSGTYLLEYKVNGQVIRRKVLIN